MVKLIQCVRRRPEVPLAEFRERWREYGEMIRVGSESLGGIRCTLSVALAVNQELLTRGGLAPFDGVAEIWFESGPAVVEAMKLSGWRQGFERFWAFQASFVDLDHSSIFWAVEDEVFDWSSELG